MVDVSKPFLTPEARIKKYNLQPNDRVTQVYGYVRVSTQKQVKEGSSIGQQIVDITNYCSTHNLSSPFIFKDEGISGMSAKAREQFNLMLYSVAAGDIIVSFNMSRVSRSRRDFLLLIDALKERHVGLILIKDNISLRYDLSDKIDASTSLIISTLAGLNQYETERTRENTSATMRAMKNAGTLLTKPRFGYTNIRGVDGKVVSIPVPEDQEVINFIHRCVLSYQSKGQRINKAQITRDVNFEIASGRIIWRNLKCVRDNQVNKIIKDNDLAGPTPIEIIGPRPYNTTANRITPSVVASTATTTTVTTTVSTVPIVPSLVIAPPPSPIVPLPTLPIAIPGAIQPARLRQSSIIEDPEFDEEDDDDGYDDALYNPPEPDVGKENRINK